MRADAVQALLAIALDTGNPAAVRVSAWKELRAWTSDPSAGTVMDAGTARPIGDLSLADLDAELSGRAPDDAPAGD